MTSLSQGWKKTVLGNIANFIGGSQPEKVDFIYEKREGYIRLLQIRDYKTEAYKTYIPLEKARRFCSKNDVMIGRYGPPVFQILRGLEGAYNVALMKAEPIEGVDNDFLYYFLKQDSLFNLIDGLSQRTAGQSGVDMDALKNYPVLLPPLPEQKRIAAILDKADAIRRKRQQAIQLADDFLRAVFLDMFGDPVKNPKGWSIKPLGETVINLDGRRIPVKSTDRAKTSGTYPYYGASGIIDYVDQYIFDERTLLVGEDGANLLARSTPIAFIAEGKYWVNNHAHVLQENGTVPLEYLMFSLNLRSIADYVTGSAQPKLNQAMLNKIPVQVPEKHLMDKFVQVLNKTRSFGNLAKKASNESLFDSLSQKAFSGQL